MLRVEAAEGLDQSPLGVAVILTDGRIVFCQEYASCYRIEDE